MGFREEGIEKLIRTMLAALVPRPINRSRWTREKNMTASEPWLTGEERKSESTRDT